MKYNLSDFKYRCTLCDNINKDTHQHYLCKYISGNLLETEIFPDWLNITKLGKYVFASLADNVINITIPNSVTLISNYAFTLCNNLENIYLYNTIPCVLGSGAFINTNNTFIIHVPVGSEETYKSATNWSQYADRIVGDIVLEESEVE